MQDSYPLKIRYPASLGVFVQELDLAAGPLLQAGLAQALADGLYLHRLDQRHVLLELVSLRGLPSGLIQDFQVQPGEGVARWLLSLNEPAQVEVSAWRDWRLESLPEFVQNRFETAVILPLSTDDKLAGFLTAARLASHAFTLDEIAFLRALQAPLESLLAGTATREENARLKAELQKVSDRLARRTYIERAKGIIQTRHGWTEEEAYLHLRRLSRKTRRPMDEIARSMIGHPTPGLLPKTR